MYEFCLKINFGQWNDKLGQNMANGLNSSFTVASNMVIQIHMQATLVAHATHKLIARFKNLINYIKRDNYITVLSTYYLEVL